ncbi:MAG: hypothetical protein EA428_16315 [Spirochaetaceae bacterium]|nr:MAG: hypothetical protein EA428_16315 [Spirochaetaceae bacterium]
MKFLVAGGTGAVGRHVCQEVVRTLGPQALVVGDYKLPRAREFARSIAESVEVAAVDVRDPDSVSRATEGVDAVIVAVRQFEALVQTVCTERGIHSVDIVPDTPLARSVLASELPGSGGRQLSGVVAAGLIPGLSGLMVRQVIEEGLDSRDIHVSLLQRKNGTAGAAGIADMLGLFSRPVEYQERIVGGFTVRRTATFPPPFGQRSLRLVAFPEAADLRAYFKNEHIHYWTAFDEEPFNMTIGMLNRIGVLRRFREPGGGATLAALLARGKKLPANTEESVALIAERGETVVRLSMPSDYAGTAMAAVAMTRILVANGAPDYGVVLPFQLFTLQQVMQQIGEAAALETE